MAFHLRVPRAGDASALADLAGQLGYPSSVAQIRQRLAALDKREDHCILVAADEDNRPIGWIHAFIAWRLESGSFAEVGGLVVTETLRSQGIGAALLAAAEAWARAAGATAIRVRSNVVRRRTHGFYLDLGYQQGKTAHLFGKDLGNGTG